MVFLGPNLCLLFYAREQPDQILLAVARMVLKRDVIPGLHYGLVLLAGSPQY